MPCRSRSTGPRRRLGKPTNCYLPENSRREQPFSTTINRSSRSRCPTVKIIEHRFEFRVNQITLPTVIFRALVVLTATNPTRANLGNSGDHPPAYRQMSRFPGGISDDIVLCSSGRSISISPASDRTTGLRVTPDRDSRAYLAGREPVMRMSTSLLALCCQSGLVATLATPIRARSRSIGSRSLRMSPLFIARFTSARSASWIRA
jgi:hypothetical protein